MSDRTREKPTLQSLWSELLRHHDKPEYLALYEYAKRLEAELKAARAECERLRARNDDLATMALTHATRANDNLREANELRALLKEAEGALGDADYVLAGSIAIEGQSDAELEAREDALMRFFATLAKLRGER